MITRPPRQREVKEFSEVEQMVDRKESVPTVCRLYLGAQ